MVKPGFTIFLAVCLAVMATSASMAAARGQCSPIGDAPLEALNIDPEKVSRRINETVVSGGEDIVVTGYRIWLRSDSCRGTVAINLDTECRVIDTFSRSECTLNSFQK